LAWIWSSGGSRGEAPEAASQFCFPQWGVSVVCFPGLHIDITRKCLDSSHFSNS
jgi:hypothetical protein